ncbi:MULTISPECIES: rhodanese-like domain-containing protein [Halopenitus]|uniref:Rhodanese-related sulfurtransferase n=1 Tax=Halopenitus malekzadehii TaxID=1267564 RepID=A0A1H6K234_9EURY|nr:MULTISPECIES: rhodanese-like domain-containing protein [Halopenitus]SEH66369.1 Rhodanese-related sulfurtransferase [Halopenitus malekzadehii]
MVEEITTEDVEAKLDDEDVQIVDIRQPGQFARGHIPGAINIPMSDLPSRIDEYEWGEEIVVACPIGQSSIQAAKLISSFEAVADDACIASMAGGYRDWDGELETEA